MEENLRCFQVSVKRSIKLELRMTGLEIIAKRNLIDASIKYNYHVSCKPVERVFRSKNYTSNIGPVFK